MNTINLTIDGLSVQVPPGTTVLDAAKQAGIHIPQLCFLRDINEIGACRICVVEIEGMGNLPASCVLPATDGMVVQTRSPKVLKSRRMTLQLLLSEHPQDCLQCVRNQNCQLQSLTGQLGIRENVFPVKRHKPRIDDKGAVWRDPNKCISCRRCIAVCDKLQSVEAYSALGRGIETTVGPEWDLPLPETHCTFCGQCVQACPVGALYERNDTEKVWQILANKRDYAVAQVAPAVRAGLSEEFGLGVGVSVTGKVAAALRRLGFDKVFDTNFTADVTIMEEGHEFLQRLEAGNLPMITSCSPAWVRFIEEFYPSLVDRLSTCKSPQQMFGALAKTYFAEQEGIDPAVIRTVSVMPCTSKKQEADRPEMQDSGYKDVDVVVTVRELAQMIRQAGIDFASLEDEEFDLPMGLSSGGAVIFGHSGGVMQAAVRMLLNKYPDVVRIEEDEHGQRVMAGEREIRVKAVSGLAQARKVLEEIKAGTCAYDLVEIMACSGGCVAGGGQPIIADWGQKGQIIAKRRAVLTNLDQGAAIQSSDQNPAVQELYEKFLGEPLSHRSHHLLHTSYRGK